MATIKKPTAKKTIIDISHPDSAPAPASGKPVIVTNRPIMKDPMVNSSEDAVTPNDSPVQKIQVKNSGELRLTPLSAPELPIEAALKETEAKESTAESPAPVEETIQEKNQEKNDQPDPQTEEKDNDEADNEPKADSSEGNGASEPANEEPAKVEPPIAKDNNDQADSPPPTVIETPEPPDHKPKDGPELANGSAQTNAIDSLPASSPADTSSKAKDTGIPDAQKIEQMEAAKKLEHDQQIAELTESKEYYLPINTVEKRRSRRFVAVGILISLILVAAWADVALDSGLINVAYSVPHTHFFSSNSSEAQPAVSLPVKAISQSQTNPASMAAETAARNQLVKVQSLLENYYHNHKTYPTSLNAAQLLSEPGSDQADATAFNVPVGTKFVYTAIPASCTTTSIKCLHYLLKAEASTGQTLKLLHSQY
ncbi:MAG TPA: hypothetical protein VFN51_01355 [Candidatus Saccharimonadales bacterium]|nr:hypothetical protein [Candidatus Saccharimonadales bacterium]